MRQLNSFELSIIIATKDRPDDIINCLNSLAESIRACDEIIVVDSSCLKNEVLRAKGGIRYFYLPRMNRMDARNFGIQVAEKDVVAFLDDDTVISQRWLQSLVETYDEYPEAGGVGGKVISYSRLRPFGRFGGRILPWGSVIHNLRGGIVPVETDILIGANWSVKKSLLKMVGGFDVNFDGFCYREETDLQVRIRRLGYKLIYQPKASVHHSESIRGRSIRNLKDHSISRVKNHTYFYMKNFITPYPWLLLLLPLFLIDIAIMLLISYGHLAFYGWFGLFQGITKLRRLRACR